MLSYHRTKKADCTISVIEVPTDEASRFGILNTDNEGKITEFEEKPKKPKSNTASMGIYIFRWKVLKKYLITDNDNTESGNDFGKNIIPKLISDRFRVYAYIFNGYWRDVGTIESLWSANMDMLNACSDFSVYDSCNGIYSKNYPYTSAYISQYADIKNSYIAEGATVYGRIMNSIISLGCTVEAGAEIINSVIMPNAIIGKNSSVKYSIVGEKSILGANVKMGDIPDYYDKNKWGIAAVGNQRNVTPNTVLRPKSFI